VEVHQDPDQALSDGKQSLTPANYQQMISRIASLAQLEGRHMQQ